MEKIIKNLFKKEIILYVFFGLCTTLVNMCSFYVMSNMLKWNDNLSNFTAIVLAVLFAYITNRKLVFHSKARNFKEYFNEFVKFIGGRIVTMAIEFLGCLFLFMTPIPTIISKCGISIVIVILNFLISKFFTFTDNK